MVSSKRFAIGWVALVACAALLGACSSSSDESAATCVGHTSSAASTPMSKTVSFKDDVLPIFEQSCVFSSCHGSKTGGNNGIYLGARGSSNATEIRDALVGKSSTRMPSMKYVTPFRPESSYLLHKLDGNFCGLDACAEGKCGDRMPKGGDALEPSQLELVQAWIAQGASDK